VFDYKSVQTKKGTSISCFINQRPAEIDL